MKIGIIGAANAGKSTLFNLLIESHRAITTDIPGTTREILEQQKDFQGHNVFFLDTPGLHDFAEEKELIINTIKESDLLLFITDYNLGVTSKDESIKQYIVKGNKKANTILVVNKQDKPPRNDKENNVYQFYELGFENIVGISASNKRNIDSLIEKIIDYLDTQEKSTEGENKIIHTGPSIPLVIIGKPNVGKSTLFNALGETTKAKVSEIPGTTLDYLKTEISVENTLFTLYDTAGLRKKSKHHILENIAEKKTDFLLEHIKPIVIVILDSTENISHKDLDIIGKALEFKVPTIIAINKIDTLGQKELIHLNKQIKTGIHFAPRIPIIPISGKKQTNIKKLFHKAKIVWKEYSKQLRTNEINNIIHKSFLSNPPKFPRNKTIKAHYTLQINSQPPIFKCFIHEREHIPAAFKKRIENVLRKNFGYEGVPITIYFEQNKKKEKTSAK